MRVPVDPLSGTRTTPPRLSLRTYGEIGRARGLVQTQLRAEVLAALWRANVPMGAYQIADELKRPDSRKAYANSVYRSIHSLVDAGLVIPVVSWKRFLISPDPRRLAWAFHHCERCHAFATEPVDILSERLHVLCAAGRFEPKTIYIESIGHCRDCEGLIPSTQVNG